MQQLEGLALGQHARVRTQTLSPIGASEVEYRDVQRPGPALWEAKSGQSGSLPTNEEQAIGFKPMVY